MMGIYPATKRSAIGSARVASRKMLEPLAETLQGVRESARLLAQHAVKYDLGRVGVSVDMPVRETVALDAARSEYVANAYVEDWLERATVGVKAAEDDVAARGALTTATDDVAWRIDRDAITEVYEAYNVEHADLTDDIYGQLTTDQREHLVRVWVAEGEHPCAVCDSFDGEEVEFNGSFDGGSPGDVHANCRCIEIIEWRE